ncbi:MAG: phage virion morphogenesis protein [Proteobacteria bacterium]|nr:phage virion morphogenesis protein [Pseudomonadota bacterium]
MSGVVIEFDAGEVLSRLNALGGRLLNLTPVMEAIGGVVRGSVDLAFTDGRDPYGIRWEPLSEVTIASRRQRSDVPLRDSGRLANSIQVAAIRDRVSVGTNVEYASTHQFGAKQGDFGRTRRNGPIPWGDVPARPFLPLDGLPPDDEREVLAAMRDGLEEALGA